MNEFLADLRSAGYDPESSCIHDIVDLDYYLEAKGQTTQEACAHSAAQPRGGGIILQKGVDVVSPADGKLGASYVHWLMMHDDNYVAAKEEMETDRHYNEGDNEHNEFTDDEDSEDQERSPPIIARADYMLSYTWSYTIGDIISSIVEFCNSQRDDINRTYVWIDFLCINQHRVIEAKKHGDSGLLNFESDFPQLLSQIGHLLAMMTPWNNPVYVERIWCIYEFYTAYTTGCDISIIMPETEIESIHADIFGDTGDLNVLYNVFGRTEIENAVSSYESDGDIILSLIRTTVGYDELNHKVNELLHCWIRGVIQTQTMDRRKYDGQQPSNRHEPYDEVVGRLLSAYDDAFDGSNVENAKYHTSNGKKLLSEGSYAEALIEFRKAHVTYKLAFGPQNADTVASLRHIGAALCDMGQYEDAMQVHRRALAVLLSSISKDGDSPSSSSLLSSIAELHNDIGLVFYQQGEYDSALNEYDQSLRICTKLYGYNSTRTAASLHRIATALEGQNELSNALRQYERSYCIYQNHYVIESHPKIISIGRKIAELKGKCNVAG